MLSVLYDVYWEACMHTSGLSHELHVTHEGGALIFQLLSFDIIDFVILKRRSRVYQTQ